MLEQVVTMILHVSLQGLEIRTTKAHADLLSQ